MFTEQRHHELVMHAGPEFLWENGDKKGTRGNAAARRGLRKFLFDYSGGLCVFCGTRPAREMCHIVSAGPQAWLNPTTGETERIRRGYIPGNIGPGCIECNESQADDGPIVSFGSIARPDLIPTAWPTETALRALGNAPEARLA